MPKKKKCKEAKQLSEEALHIAEKEEKLKAKEKKKDIPILMQSFPSICHEVMGLDVTILVF